MNRSQIFTFLLDNKTWTDYEWAQNTKVTRATFGNNRKNNGKNIRVSTLRTMANVCDYKLVQVNPWISPSNKSAHFRLLGREII